MSDYFKCLERVLVPIQPEENFKSGSSEQQQQQLCSSISAFQFKNLIIQLVLFGNLLVEKLTNIKLAWAKKTTSGTERKDNPCHMQVTIDNDSKGNYCSKQSTTSGKDRRDKSCNKQSRVPPTIPIPHPKTLSPSTTSDGRRGGRHELQGVFKTAATFILVSNLLAHLQGCAVAAETTPKCNPQPPDCMQCEGVLYYHNSHNNTCEMCPICPPGFQPDRPCGEPDTSGQSFPCVPCGQNTFSKVYDQGRCSSCQVCENTINDMPCNVTSDRECGPCSSGFGLLRMDRKGQCIPCFLLDSRTADRQESCNPQSTTTLYTTAEVTPSKPNMLISTKDDKELQSTKTPEPASTNIDVVYSTKKHGNNEIKATPSEPPEANASSRDTPGYGFETRKPSWSPPDKEDSSAENKHPGPVNNGRHHPVSEKNVFLMTISFALIVIVGIFACICVKRMDLKYRRCAGRMTSKRKRVQVGSGAQCDWDSGSSGKIDMSSSGEHKEIEIIVSPSPRKNRKQTPSTVCKNVIYSGVSQNSTDSHENLKQPSLPREIKRGESLGISASSNFPNSKGITARRSKGYRMKEASESSSNLLQSYDSPATSKKSLDSPISSLQPLMTNGGRFRSDLENCLNDVEGAKNVQSSPFEDNLTGNSYSDLNSRNKHPVTLNQSQSTRFELHSSTLGPALSPNKNGDSVASGIKSSAESASHHDKRGIPVQERKLGAIPYSQTTNSQRQTLGRSADYIGVDAEDWNDPGNSTRPQIGHPESQVSFQQQLTPGHSGQSNRAGYDNSGNSAIQYWMHHGITTNPIIGHPESQLSVQQQYQQLHEQQQQQLQKQYQPYQSQPTSGQNPINITSNINPGQTNVASSSNIGHPGSQDYLQQQHQEQQQQQCTPYQFPLTGDQQNQLIVTTQNMKPGQITGALGKSTSPIIAQPESQAYLPHHQQQQQHLLQQQYTCMQYQFQPPDDQQIPPVVSTQNTNLEQTITSTPQNIQQQSSEMRPRHANAPTVAENRRLHNLARNLPPLATKQVRKISGNHHDHDNVRQTNTSASPRPTGTQKLPLDLTRYADTSPKQGNADENHFSSYNNPYSHQRERPNYSNGQSSVHTPLSPRLKEASTSPMPYPDTVQSTGPVIKQCHNFTLVMAPNSTKSSYVIGDQVNMNEQNKN